jgi:hypothetical protein
MSAGCNCDPYKSCHICMKCPPCSVCASAQGLQDANGNWLCLTCVHVILRQSGTASSSVKPGASCGCIPGQRMHTCLVAPRQAVSKTVSKSNAHLPGCNCQGCTLASKIKNQFMAAMGKTTKVWKYLDPASIVDACECGSKIDGGNLHYDWCQMSPNYVPKNPPTGP